VKKWTHRNRNNSKLIRLEIPGERGGKYNNSKYNMHMLCKSKRYGRGRELPRETVAK